MFGAAVAVDQWTNQSDPNLADDEKAEKEFGLKRKYTVRTYLHKKGVAFCVKDSA